MKMRLSWADLVKRLKSKNAYDGDGSLDSVLEFVRENEIPVQDKTGREIDLPWLHKNKTVTISVAADAGEDVVMLGSKMADEDEEDSKSKMDDEDDEDGEKSATILRLQKELDRTKRQMDLAGSTGSKSTSVDAKLFQNRSNRNAAHKAYNHRVAQAGAGLIPKNKRPVFGDAETAEAFGALCRAKWFAAYNDRPRDDDLAIVKSYLGTKAQSEGVNSAGGAVVFPEFSPYLVSLFEDYGIARQLFNVMPMSSDTLTFSRESTRPTVSGVAELGTLSESEITLGNIMLVAKKAGGITRHSNELLADSAINFADVVARAWAWAFTKFEDDCAFLGDGTSTYNGIVGVNSALLDVDGAGTDSAGVIAGDASTASDWDNFTVAPFLEAQGALPNYVRNPVWVCHKAFYYAGWGTVALGAGGAYAAEFEAGLAQSNPTILGMPVRFHQTFPNSAANTSADEIVITLGDYAMGAAFGDRQSVEIVGSDQRYFDTDEFALRALERFDIKAHDVGSSSVVGPIVAITAE